MVCSSSYNSVMYCSSNGSGCVECMVGRRVLREGTVSHQGLLSQINVLHLVCKDRIRAWLT